MFLPELCSCLRMHSCLFGGNNILGLPFTGVATKAITGVAIRPDYTIGAKVFYLSGTKFNLECNHFQISNLLAFSTKYGC